MVNDSYEEGSFQMQKRDQSNKRGAGVRMNTLEHSSYGPVQSLTN